MRGQRGARVFATTETQRHQINAADGWLLSLAAGQSGGTQAGATVVIELAEAISPGHCALAYTAARPDSPPQIVTHTTGC